MVVGGGPTGVETAGALAELFAMVFRKDYPTLDVGRARVVLVEMQDHLLHPFTASSRRHALDTLRSRGVEVRLGAQVASVGRRRGHASPTARCCRARRSCGRPACRPTRWPPPSTSRRAAAAAWSWTPDLRVPGRPGAWAIGDVAAATDRRGEVLPQLAPVAMQSGRHVARQIRRLARGPTHRAVPLPRQGHDGDHRPPGRGGRAPGRIRLRGGLAWLAWLGLHLVTLVGPRNRASVLLNWAWNYLTWDRGPRLITGYGPAP